MVPFHLYIVDDALPPAALSAKNVSVPILSKRFKNEIGVSPSAYYNKLKIEEAKHLLLQKNVNETSWDLGYENVSHFIRLFTKAFGVTPLHWKRETI